MSATTRLREKQKVISPIPTRHLIRAILIDVYSRRVVDILMTPSFEEVAKLVSTHFVPHRFGALAGDTLYTDEGTFKGYEDFTFGEFGVTGNALIVHVGEHCVLADCHMDRIDVEKMVEWKNAPSCGQVEVQRPRISQEDDDEREEGKNDSAET